MHHLIIGYGYCGFYLAQYLLKEHQNVTAISRHLQKEFHLSGLNHQQWDINSPLLWDKPDTILYYLIPPLAEGKQDILLGRFLENCRIKPAKIIYFGSSAVYGNHQGNWVDENAHMILEHSKQYRRVDAENKWEQYCLQNGINYALLRIGGIYGPHRLPLQNAIDRAPIIYPDQAPFINHIYVKDLAIIAAQLALQFEGKTIVNVANGNPAKMGSLQKLVGQSLGLPHPPFETFTDAWGKASSTKREFMQASKRLNITKLQSILQESLYLTSLEQGVAESMMEQ